MPGLKKNIKQDYDAWNLVSYYKHERHRNQDQNYFNLLNLDISVYN